jgi:bifunctional non-homologous end joining protein LigD
MPLEHYRAKRNLGRTPEPSGGTPAAGGRSFVVQKHWATRMHFDFRLEHNGVLLSWAVPKGPSANPADKHVAIHVEDHPVDYADFEGIIPEGNYGAGAVIVWDRGTYVPLEDIDEGFEKGKLLFEMRGHKLHGRWTLVKIKKADKEWLLIKERDAYVSTDPGVYPESSVFSGLTVEQLKHGQSPATSILASLADGKAPERRIKAGDVSVMLAESRAEPFSRAGWVFEMKYDGYRIVAGRDGDDVTLLSRNKNNLTASFPDVARAISALPYQHFVIDGEVVVCDANGRPNFQKLQKRGMLRRGADVKRAAAELPATLYVFDLLAFGGHDVRGLPLTERKRILQQIIPARGVLQYADHIETRGEEFFRAAQALDVEGMIGKKADSKYRAGRSADWVKVRVHKSDDFVVVGFTAPAASRSGFGSLHLAQYDGTGKDARLVYAGTAGSGFTQKLIDSTYAELEPLIVKDAPCERAPTGKDHTWVQPRMVCEVKFLEVTDDGLLRHPVFMHFRTDKSPDECVRRAELPAMLDEPPPAPAAGNEKAIAFTNPDKVFWPEEGYTKKDLIDYYRSVSAWILPFLKDRPVVMTRFPDGINGKSFFQKDAPDFAPDWLRRETVWSEESQRDLNYFVCDDEAALLYIANMGTIPLHVWASRVGSLEQPDWCILDLDPKAAPFSDVVKVAQATKTLCDEIGLPACIKTSGSSGLHVMIPLGRQCTHEQSKMLGQLLARAIVGRIPGIATVERMPHKREGKVYVDFLQNGHGKLLVAPYSVRPLPGATVSAPLEWKEVNGKLDLKNFTIRTMAKRLERMRKDPLRAVLSLRPDLVAALSGLQERMR